MDWNPERSRVETDARRTEHWTHWGPYLSDRQWGTVREDYSASGEAWTYFPFEHARSRAYRWGEDGIFGISDDHQRLCFAPAFWNGNDPFLKERLYGLSGPEGNHGEDVKECYYYLDNVPSHAYMKALYKYPQRAFPYDALRSENARRSRQEPEYELVDTGILRTMSISMSSSSMPNARRQTRSCALRRRTAGSVRRRCTSFHSCGSATSGRGRRDNRTGRSHPPPLTRARTSRGTQTRRVLAIRRRRSGRTLHRERN